MIDGWCVYVLRSRKDGRLYTGFSTDLARRLDEHARGASSYTRRIRPLDLVYHETRPDRLDARRREKWLKTGRGREELLRLIGD
ncbi:MAG: GIY-YIG nuclease family protein [Dehalococcoidia bacterium]